MALLFYRYFAFAGSKLISISPFEAPSEATCGALPGFAGFCRVLRTTR